MVSAVFQCGWTFQCDFQCHILIVIDLEALRQDTRVLNRVENIIMFIVSEQSLHDIANVEIKNNFNFGIKAILQDLLTSVNSIHIFPNKFSILHIN